MKFWEAIKALEDGNKIRCKDWPGGYYLYAQLNVYDERILVDEECRAIFSAIHVDKEWEIYQDPVKTYSFMESMELLKEGKKVKRKEWHSGWLTIERSCICHQDEYMDPAPRHFYLKDIEASDWVVVE